MGGYDSKDITVEQLCRLIDMLHPCMDDYLYVYDLENDYYYIHQIFAPSNLTQHQTVNCSIIFL